jgi:hypothetical protein
LKKIILPILLSFSLYAQEHSPALEDNSFFIEEAYNQEPGVLQHIFKGAFFENDDLALSFSEEIPIVSEKHQIAFEIAYLLLSRPERNGIGDLAVQYRYQLFGKEDWAAAAPAFSVVMLSDLEEGDEGNTFIGYQVLLPFSKRLSENFTAHLNAGVLYFPEAEISSTEFFGGGSIIWLPTWNLNFHFEYLFTTLSENGKSSSEHLFIPGIRYGINVGSLQIVPGLATAVNTKRDTNEVVMLYLSFEHPL